jgi:hypothetical protein
MAEDLVHRVADGLGAASDYLVQELVPRLGSVDLVRERHLVEALGAGLAGSTGAQIALGTVIPIPGWPSLGRSGVDVAVLSGPSRYSAIFEAKWCHSGKDKIYEAIWDLFKMALGLRRPDTHASFLVTGAPSSMWRTGFCTDLLEGGEFHPPELCGRLLPWGREPRWLAWDDLLYGGHDRFPDNVPARLATEPLLDELQLRTEPPWTIRAVRISVLDPTPVPFLNGWPNGLRPANARHPKEP